MPVRVGEAFWEGTLFDGKGTMKVKSGLLNTTYSAAMRFSEAPGTNPEELIGAALAGCFSQALSLNLENAGFKKIQIHSKAMVHLEKSENGYKITTIKLNTKAAVPEISKDQFQNIAETTKNTCPVSKALCVPISLEASLEQ